MRGIAIIVLVMMSCGGTQRPVSWDVSALAAIHGGAHALALVDTGAATFYRSRTDTIAADGGPGGTPLRGISYLVATRELDVRYTALVRDMSITRDALMLGESAVRQAAALGEASARCRAFVALDDLGHDLGLVASDLSNLGVTAGSGLSSAAHDLEAVGLELAPGCILRDDAGADGSVDTIAGDDDRS